jgi:tetratricopeptide (TPR) repeat protein
MTGMARRHPALHKSSAASVIPRSTMMRKRSIQWPIAGIVVSVMVIAYLIAVCALFRPSLPWIGQRMLGLSVALAVLAPYLVFTRHKGATKLDLFRARLAQRSDFGKQLYTTQHTHRRTVNLPVLGKTSVRALGGTMLFVVTFLWWWTPLAPVRVRERVIDDLTVPFGEEILAAVMVVPDGRIAVLAPPVVPPRALKSAGDIKVNADAYQRGLKAIAEGRNDNAGDLLTTAAEEGKADPLLVQLAQAQNDMYAYRFVAAARRFERLARQKPEIATYQLQAAVAWLHAGMTENAELALARAMKGRTATLGEKDREKNSERDRDLARCYHVQAVLRIAQGKQFADAEGSCARTRELMEKSTPLEEDYGFQAASLNNQAVLLLLEGKYPAAINYFEEARYAWTRAYGARHPLMAATSASQAALYVFVDKYREAEEALSRAEGIVRGLLPREQPLVAHTLLARSLLREALGDYDNALTLARDALAIVEKTLEPQHPANVPVLDVLTLIHTDRARYAKAEARCGEGLEWSRQIWGRQHPFYAQMLCRSAELDMAVHRYAEAATAGRQALDIFEQSLGKDHPEAAVALEILGRLEIEQNKPSEARPHLEKALTILGDTLGKEHVSYACALANLGALEKATRYFLKGDDDYKRAIAIGETLLGRDHPSLVPLLRGQAMLFLEERRFNEATTCLDRALAIQEKSTRMSHPDLAVTLESYVTLLRATSSPDLHRIEEMESRAKTVREKHAEKDRPEL